MLNMIMAGLPDEQVIESNPLATVTTNCLVVRNSDGKSQTVILLSRLSSIRKATTIYPGLVVIAVGLLVISAAAVCSKESHGAALPIGITALLFLLGFLAHRRASLAFIAGSGATVTTDGNPAEADALIQAVQSARKTADPTTA
jgi:hypothetical protein